jgi:SOS-response transcriptional repressor LexA
MHKWIKARLREIGKKQKDLAAAMSLPHTRVSEIISGKRAVRSHEAAILASFLGLSGDEVLQRLGGEISDAEFSVVRQPVIHVPLISWVQAGELAEISDPLPPGDAEEWVAVASMKATLIALRVRGTSINRVAPDGAVIIVDYADTDPISGKLYAFRNGDGAGAVKRYKANPPRFEPDSTDPHETIFPDEHTHIIGRVETVIVSV